MSTEKPARPRIPSGFVTSRREFLQKAGGGFGMLALAHLLQQERLLGMTGATGAIGDGAGSAAAAAGLAGALGPHFAPKAKSVIWLFMYGGPSGFDLFDPKPTLDRLHGTPAPGKIETFNTDNGALMRSPYAFKQHGQSGAWVSEKYPALARCVDRIAFLKAVHCESNNHAPALFQLNTGMTRVGFPSVGAWVTYGLGSPNANLPGFVVMYDHRGGPIGGPQNWGAGFLPGGHQGTPFRASGTPILNLARPPDVDAAAQRSQLDLLAQLNAEHVNAHPAGSAAGALESRIESYELAWRMQSSAPEAIDLAGESDATRRLYGLDRDITRPFGTQCLIARRLVERGVRFLELYSAGGHQQDSWDAHFGLKENHDLHCAETDVPIAGLLQDLEQRGLLDETLVVWGGEFGRMPMSQGSNGGRDHNPDGFVMWLAGGGIKGGVSHGATDDVGHRAVEGRVSVNDLHATILHLLGLDHTKLTFFHKGRDFRLTDVAGNVVQEVLA